MLAFRFSAEGFWYPADGNEKIRKPYSLRNHGGVKWARTIDLHDVNVTL